MFSELARHSFQCTHTVALSQWALRKASRQQNRIYNRRRRGTICTYVGTKIQNWRDTNKTQSGRADGTEPEPNQTILTAAAWNHKETEITFNLSILTLSSTTTKYLGPLPINWPEHGTIIFRDSSRSPPKRNESVLAAVVLCMRWWAEVVVVVLVNSTGWTRDKTVTHEVKAEVHFYMTKSRSGTPKDITAYRFELISAIKLKRWFIYIFRR